MKGSKLGRAAVALAAPLALMTGLAPTASAVDPYPYGSWSVSVRENTITVKFIYYRAPEADHPHYCNAVIDGIPDVRVAEIYYAEYETVKFDNVPDGDYTVDADCQDDDHEYRSVGSIDVSIPGPAQTRFVGSRHFSFG